MSSKRQASILNWEQNFQALSRKSNSLKSNKSYRQLTDDADLGPINRQFQQEMARKEEELWRKLQQKVEDALKEQYRLGESPFR